VVQGKGSGLAKKKEQAFNSFSPIPSHASSSQPKEPTPSSLHLPFYSQTTILLPKINQSEERPEKSKA
jgi:hypothetical protein